MSATKILVNKMPSMPYDCPFCEGGLTSFQGVCTILKGSCALELGLKCPCLMSYYEFENYGNGIQSPWDKED